MFASVPMDLVPLFPSGRQGALHGFEGVPAVVVVSKPFELAHGSASARAIVAIAGGVQASTRW